ncbi:unnamed protein product, partial [Allacma fusca]
NLTPKMDSEEDFEIHDGEWLGNMNLADSDMDTIIQDIFGDVMGSHASKNQGNLTSEDPISHNSRGAIMDRIPTFQNKYPHMCEIEPGIQSNRRNGYTEYFNDCFWCGHCNFKFSVREALQMHAFVVHGL